MQTLLEGTLQLDQSRIDDDCSSYSNLKALATSFPKFKVRSVACFYSFVLLRQNLNHQSVFVMLSHGVFSNMHVYIHKASTLQNHDSDTEMSELWTVCVTLIPAVAVVFD